jgi:hypothetical protein
MGLTYSHNSTPQTKSNKTLKIFQQILWCSSQPPEFPTCTKQCKNGQHSVECQKARTENRGVLYDRGLWKKTLSHRLSSFFRLQLAVNRNSPNTSPYASPTPTHRKKEQCKYIVEQETRVSPAKQQLLMT